VATPDEFQSRAAGAGGGSLDGDGAFEDLGFEERLHQFVVGAVAQGLVFVAASAGPSVASIRTNSAETTSGSFGKNLLTSAHGWRVSGWRLR
jgi:hypothetical protein